jgi:hypothetical protein
MSLVESQLFKRDGFGPIYSLMDVAKTAPSEGALSSLFYTFDEERRRKFPA